VLYWQLGPEMAIRKGDWKLVKYLFEFAAEKPSSPKSLLSPPRLYDLSQDIGEHKDLASAQPDKVNELQGLWDQWNQTLAAPLWQQQASASRD
jgi:arylsulfatase A-like enzyme